MTDLEIDDGSPWWLSPDIWTVPGNDPLGPAGPPTVGQTCFVWTRVHNHDSVSVDNAPVGYYWANPNVGWDRSQATFLGSAFAAVAAGGASEVLCLVPWMPSWVNDGHVCLITEVGEPGQPLPTTGPFDVINNPRVAQRNVNLITTHTNQFHFSFDVHNPERNNRRSVLRVDIDEHFEAPPDLRSLVGKRASSEVRSVGLLDRPCPDIDTVNGADQRELELDIPGNASSGATIAGRTSNGVAVFHVRQFVGEAELGGLTVIVRNDGKER
jgi:hypothetical protein